MPMSAYRRHPESCERKMSKDCKCETPNNIVFLACCGFYCSCGGRVENVLALDIKKSQTNG